MRKLLAGIAVALALGGAASAATVDAADYRQFWLWKPRPDVGLDHAGTLYLLQGHVGAGGFTHQGNAPAALGGREIYLVYRLESLDWNAVLLASVVNQIHAWQHAGNQVAGIQLDFDARTPRLADYAGFLRMVRRDLPPAYRLSVTGLLDWSTGGAPEAFDVMAGTVDEIVFQTYQARRTIGNAPAYLPAIARLHVPFKLGLIEGGAWDPSDERIVAASPFYRGAVVFLLGHR